MYGNISVNNLEDDVNGIFLSGNLERSGSIGIHALQEVGVLAAGPGSERVTGIVDNTELYQIIAEALGFGTYAMISRPAHEPEYLPCGNGEG
jgi:alkaline phosphatase